MCRSLRELKCTFASRIRTLDYNVQEPTTTCVTVIPRTAALCMNK